MLSDSRASGPGKLHRPSDVAVDADGDVYVTDWGQDKVEVYDAHGGHLTTFFGDSKELSPRGVEYLRLNVADNEKRRLVTNFEPEHRFTLAHGCRGRWRRTHLRRRQHPLSPPSLPEGDEAARALALASFKVQQ